MEYGPIMQSAIQYRLSLLLIAGGLSASFGHHVIFAPAVADSLIGTIATFIPPLVAAGAALALLSFTHTSSIENATLGRAAGWYIAGAIVFAISVYLSLTENLGHSTLPEDTWFTVVNWSIGGSAIGLAVANYDLRRTWALEQAKANHRTAARVSQRMSVLNRVLRHDVRNKLNIILGHVHDPSIQAADGEAATAIEEAAEALLTIAVRARRVQQIVEDESPEPLNVTTAVTELVEALRDEYPAARISLQEAADATVATYPDIRSALEALLENAIEHNPQPEAECRVEVSVHRVTTDGGAMAEVVIEDNGPGMPDEELVVTNVEPETQLGHSRGTSLWLARWIVDESGGDFTIETTDTGGTRLRLRLPLAD